MNGMTLERAIEIISAVRCTNDGCGRIPCTECNDAYQLAIRVLRAQAKRERPD